MDFNKQQDIEKQLQEISDLSIQVNVVINNTISLTACRLIYTTENEKELFIQVPTGDYPETGNVELICAHPKALYVFKSKIISQKETGFEDSLYLRIEVPDNITHKERRKHFRVKPSEAYPIHIRLAVPDSDIINVVAMDIGGGGISFAVPEDINHFNIGDSLYLDVNLPVYNWLSALVIVKNITAQRKMVRIGVAFSRVSEDVYKMIMEYVADKIVGEEPDNT